MSFRPFSIQILAAGNTTHWNPTLMWSTPGLVRELSLNPQCHPHNPKLFFSRHFLPSKREQGCFALWRWKSFLWIVRSEKITTFEQVGMHILSLFHQQQTSCSKKCLSVCLFPSELPYFCVQDKKIFCAAQLPFRANGFKVPAEGESFPANCFDVLQANEHVRR